MLNTILLYSLASFSVTVIPGPTMLLSLSNGTTKRQSIILSGICGAALSDIFLISSVALGLGAILTASDTLFSIIKYCGVLYLIWLAINLWKGEITKDIFKVNNDDKLSLTPSKAFNRSLFIALSNPKGLMFFGAFLPQFINVNEPLLLQYVFFISATVVIDMTIMFLYASLGFQISKYFSSKKIIFVNKFCAFILAFMASALLLYRRQ